MVLWGVGGQLVKLKSRGAAEKVTFLVLLLILWGPANGFVFLTKRLTQVLLVSGIVANAEPVPSGSVDIVRAFESVPNLQRGVRADSLLGSQSQCRGQAHLRVRADSPEPPWEPSVKKWGKQNPELPLRVSL